jgi:hypothetical protein
LLTIIFHRLLRGNGTIHIILHRLLPTLYKLAKWTLPLK